MTFGSFFLIFRRQLKEKWGRVVLASAGIMIGVWAIMLTSGLSLGLSNTIITAINSQPSAKFFQTYKLEDGNTSFLELQGPPKFVAMEFNEVRDLANKYPEIIDSSPSEALNLYIQTNKANEDTACVDQFKEILTTLPEGSVGLAQVPEDQKSQAQKNFEIQCEGITIISDIFQNFYETNRTNWYGKTEKPGLGEIVVCYRCGNIEFSEKMGVNSPEELLGKKIIIELNQAPDFQQSKEIIDIANYQRAANIISKTEKIEVEIVSVVDDRNSNGFSFSGGANNNFWISFDYYLQAIKKARPEVDTDTIGFIEYNLFVDSYDNLDTTIKNIRADGYLAFSFLQAVIAGIEVAFQVLTIALAIFGLIAMVASVFGIINVMAISVLERKKEIGILKSLGARDGDIFKLFFLESTSLGFFGWTLGTIFSLAFGYSISLIFFFYLENDQAIKNNLASLGITEFYPIFPWWLFLGTLLLALIFTSLSGIFPAINASRQNPVDVLRGE